MTKYHKVISVTDLDERNLHYNSSFSVGKKAERTGVRAGLQLRANHPNMFPKVSKT